MLRLLAAVAVVFTFAAAPAFAVERAFTARLDGATQPTVTGSAATGTATIRVDTDTRTVDVDMNITGLFVDDLFDHVIHNGMGPVHLHLYAENGDISLLVPFPYGATYTESDDGFRLVIENYSYAEGAALLRSEMTFEQFVAALDTDFIYLNVHTDRVPDGEISGRLAPAA